RAGRRLRSLGAVELQRNPRTRQHFLTLNDALGLGNITADRALEHRLITLRLQDLHRLRIRVTGDIKRAVVAAGVAGAEETHGRKRRGPAGEGNKLFHVTSVAGRPGEDIAETRVTKPTGRSLGRVAT